MSDKGKQHTARIEYKNKIEYAIFYKETGIEHDIETTYPSLESAQSALDFDDDRDQLVIYQRPTPKEWKDVPKP